MKTDDECLQQRDFWSMCFHAQHDDNSTLNKMLFEQQSKCFDGYLWHTLMRHEQAAGWSPRQLNERALSDLQSKAINYANSLVCSKHGSTWLPMNKSAQLAWLSRRSTSDRLINICFAFDNPLTSRRLNCAIVSFRLRSHRSLVAWFGRARVNSLDMPSLANCALLLSLSLSCFALGVPTLLTLACQWRRCAQLVEWVDERKRKSGTKASANC